MKKELKANEKRHEQGCLRQRGRASLLVL